MIWKANYKIQSWTLVVNVVPKKIRIKVSLKSKTNPFTTKARQENSTKGDVTNLVLESGLGITWVGMGSLSTLRSGYNWPLMYWFYLY